MQIHAKVPLSQKMWLLWERLTVSRLTIVYFIFSLLHCLVQIVLQVRAFGINQEASSMLASMIEQTNSSISGFPVLDRQLRICQHIPRTLNADSCQVVWAGTPAAARSANVSVAAVPGASTVSIAAPASTAQPVQNVAAVNVPGEIASPVTIVARAGGAVAVVPSVTASSTTVFMVTPTPAPQVPVTPAARTVKRRAVETFAPINIDGEATVIVDGLGFHHQSMTVSRKCLLTLNWPDMILENTKREDITFITFQFWLLGMSIVAILNESIPHIIASMTTHVLATGWGAYQILKTRTFRDDVERLISDGACGTNFLGEYWPARSQAEMPSAALNVVALFVSGFLSWRLIKQFGWQTFKRVGASITINRVYKLVLSLSITIQLALFFLVCGMGLWIDQLCNGFIGRHAEQALLYKVMISIVCALLGPWLMLGWFGTRLENRPMMMTFLIMSLLYVAGWVTMLDSSTFRWTFVTWRFFGIVVCFGVVLTLVVVGLGIACRLNFGKGLPQFLNDAKEDEFPEDDDESFVPRAGRRAADAELGEKIAYPVLATPVPTFALSFGGTALESDQVAPPAGAHTRTPSTPRGTMRRQDSTASTMSYASMRSEKTVRGGGGSSRSNSVRSVDKRWVIE